jgi:hypothetical protein
LADAENQMPHHEPPTNVEAEVKKALALMNRIATVCADPAGFQSRRTTSIGTTTAAAAAGRKNTPAKRTAPPRAVRKTLQIGRADRPDRDARRGAACDPHRPIVKHLANHPRPNGYTRQVECTEAG